MKHARWNSLLILCTGSLLTVVDMPIVNVALPPIQRNLGFAPSESAVVVTLALAVTLLPGRGPADKATTTVEWEAAA